MVLVSYYQVGSKTLLFSISKYLSHPKMSYQIDYLIHFYSHHLQIILSMFTNEENEIYRFQRFDHDHIVINK